jgi:hypothetical protein
MYIYVVEEFNATTIQEAYFSWWGRAQFTPHDWILTPNMVKPLPLPLPLSLPLSFLSYLLFKLVLSPSSLVFILLLTPHSS